MIPLKLTLSAFCPFAEEQTIDFTEFENDRIFLITGDTGSGKTSIFDAIAYSLYGAASGSLRQTDSFKSQFAAQNDLCFVEFEFILKNKKYIVRREPAQLKLKRGGNYSESPPTALLTYENGDTISGITAVNAAVEELFGINCDQFKKIVMLAQGEFRRFLLDGADEKQIILRKIFGTQNLNNFTEAIKSDTFKIKREIEDISIKIATLIQTLVLLPSTPLFEAAASETPDCNRVLKLLSESLYSDESAIKGYNSRLEAIEAEIKSHNEFLSICKTKQDAQKQLDELLNEKPELEKTLLKVKKSYQEAKAALALLPKNAVKTQELQQALKQITLRDSLFSEIDELKAKQKKNIAKFKLQTAALEKITLTEKAELIQAKLVQHKNALSLISQYNSAIALYSKIGSDYKTAMNCFLDGQAYSLAAKLEGGVPCPVCGSTEHPSTAKPPDRIIEKKELEAFKTKYELALSDSERLQALCNEALQSLEISSDNFLKADGLIKSNIERLSQEAAALQDELSQSEFTENVAVTDKESVREALNRLETELAVLTERQKNAEATLKGLAVPERSRIEIEAEIEQLAAQAESVNKAFERSDKAQALSEKKLTQLNHSITLLKQTVSDSQKHAQAIAKAQKISLDEAAAAERLEELKLELNSINAAKNEVSIRYSANSSAFEKLEGAAKAQAALAEKYGRYSKICDVATGRFSDRVDFERFILTTYFDEILQNTNIRLEEMTNSRYTLKRRLEKEKRSKASGLALEVFDAYTGASRHVNTTSGGESFILSLCLALGLADIVSQNAGGIELNTLFIDEGFGSLDSNALDLAIDCLEKLKASGRYIGIISHVAELKERIPQKINVTRFAQGSRITQ